MVKKKKNITLKDIASKAGVSTSLVSFVLNGKQKRYRVNQEVAERIKRIAQELDYKPNDHAKGQKNNISRTIGVIVPQISNHFFSKIVQAIEYYTEKYNYLAIFASSEEKAEKMELQIDRMLKKQVDGLILVPCEGSEDTIQTLVDRDVPIVLIDRYFPDIRTHYVSLNNEASAYKATVHLITQGFSKVVFIGYDMNLSHMKSRIKGYTQAMTDYNFTNNIRVKYVNNSTEASNYGKVLKSVIDSGADSILFATNTIAINSLYYLQRNSIRIPEQLGLVGFDSDTAFDFFYAPLTCIKQPIEQMAEKATAILLEHINSKAHLLHQVEAEGTLIVRASSKLNIL